MAAVRHVDVVVAFEEDTPLELIRALLPDVLVKGADYARSRWWGRLRSRPMAAGCCWCGWRLGTRRPPRSAGS